MTDTEPTPVADSLSPTRMGGRPYPPRPTRGVILRRPMTSLSPLDELAASFQRDGACVVRGLLEPSEVELLAAGVERNMAEPSERALEGGGGDSGSGRFFEDFRNWTRIAEYERVIRESRLGEVAARLMGSETARLHH